MSNKAVYCWDTSVFIAWLKEETSKTDWLSNIHAIACEIETCKSVLVVPATIFTELQESKFDAGQWEQFEQCLKRTSVIVADITMAIARRAGQIRDRAEAEGRRIKTPDATVIATAITYGAHALHTFDEALLKLDRSETAEGLAITRPVPRNGQCAML